jgi:hypothetical protein
MFQYFLHPPYDKVGNLHSVRDSVILDATGSVPVLGSLSTYPLTGTNRKVESVDTGMMPVPIIAMQSLQ